MPPCQLPVPEVKSSRKTTADSWGLREFWAKRLCFATHLKVTQSNTIANTQMNFMKISGDGLRNSEIGFMGESTLEYFSPKLKLFSSLGYSRGMSRIPELHGFSEYGFDLWNLSVGKYLLKDRLVLSLDYVIPLNIGVRRSQKSEIRTPFYLQKNALDLGIYDNMLIFRLTFRFGKGKETREIRDNTRYDNESIDKRGLM